MLRDKFLLCVGIFIVFFVLLLIKKKPGQFYFSMGELNAKVKPVKGLAVYGNIVPYLPVISIFAIVNSVYEELRV